MNGQIPFEGDSFIPQEILKLKEKFGLEYAFETGSQYGSTLKWFTDNFHFALGCEPNVEFYDVARKIEGVRLINCYSLGFIEILPNYTDKFFLYIDSHWSNTPCPLKDELKLIADLKLKPVISIHDFKVPEKDFGYDAYDYELCFEEIEPYLKLIYPNGYEYHYNEQSNGARRGIIFIYPKV